MAVSSAIIDLTDEDDVMHVDDGQVTEEIVTSPSWTSVVSNSNEHENEQMAPDQASHEERETRRDYSICRYKYIAMYA